MLGPEDVGHRVVVRRIVGLRANRPIFSDLLGELVALDGAGVTLRTERHGTLSVPFGEMALAKRVPDRRPPTAIELLERAAEQGWPAPDREPLGDWLLRAAEGWSNRANSALAIGDPGRELPAAVEAVEAWYQARGLLPKITVPAPGRGHVTAELGSRGWIAQPLVLVQTAPLTDIAQIVAQAGTGSPVEVRLDGVPGAAWLDGVAERRGLPAAARHILTAVRQVRFAGVYDRSGALLAAARGAVADDGQWLGISLVQVQPEQRRRGLAQAVTAALARWAATAGAQRAYVQVEQHNTAAVALWARLGLRTHHTYTTWRRD